MPVYTQAAPEARTYSYEVPATRASSPSRASVVREVSTSGGRSFTAQDGIGIAAALIPLVSLFKGGGKSREQGERRAAGRREPVIPQSRPWSQNTKLLVIGGGVAAVLGVGVLLMLRD